MNVEKLKKRCGYDGKPQQFKYGFDLACRELAQAQTVPEIQQSKQAEIDDLKAQLKAAHESRIEFVEYCRKIESNDFVLVPKDKISHFYQDNDEPENFCNSSDDWDCLGDGIDKDQIMIVNKHTQANISTERFYGAWKLIETSYGIRWKFELFKSESEAKQAMIEAQEQTND